MPGTWRHALGLLLPLAFLAVVASRKVVDNKQGSDSWIRDLRSVPKPTFDKTGKYKTYSKHLVRSDPATGEYTQLSYNCTLLANQFVELEDPSFEIESVSCAGEKVSIKTSTADGMSNLVHALEDSPTGLIYAPDRWGCTRVQGGPTAPMYRTFWADGQSAPEGAGHNHAAWTLPGKVVNNVITLTTADAAMTAFFGKTQMSFFSNHSSALGVNARRVREEEESDLRADGKFPFGEKTFDLLNFNYNQDTGRATTEDLVFHETSTAKVTCKNCYFYAGGGIGFEFQTESFDFAPEKLAFMRAWVKMMIAASANLVGEVMFLP